jgi:hypothetical protein
MTKPVKEITIEDFFCAQMLTTFPGAEVRKYEVRRGEPDRICLLPGGFAAFVELKRPKKKPQPEQERAIKRLVDAGFFADWASTKDEVDGLIELLQEYIQARSK